MATETEAIAEAVAYAKLKHEQLTAQAAEEAKWSSKRKVMVTAIAKPSSDPNSKKFGFYWVPGHKLAHGETIEIELTEREIFNMKKDPFVQVDDPTASTAEAKPAVADSKPVVADLPAPAPVPDVVDTKQIDFTQEPAPTKKSKYSK